MATSSITLASGSETSITLTSNDGSVIVLGGESVGLQGVQGVKGDPGQQGVQGPPGPGVPIGGTAGQVLAKSTSTNFDTIWVTPTGGGSSNSLTLVDSSGVPWVLSVGTGGNLITTRAATSNKYGGYYGYTTYA